MFSSKEGVLFVSPRSIFTIECYLLTFPFGDGMSPLFEQTSIKSKLRFVVASICLGLGEKMKMGKINNNAYDKQKTKIKKNLIFIC